MSEITLEKTHVLLEKLTDYIIKKMPNIEQQLEAKADKDDVGKLLEGQDKIIKELEIMRTEQSSFNHAINRIEERVEKLEQVH